MKQAVKVGGIYYRVYKHQGKIMVSRGVIRESGTFEPFNGSSPWLIKNPMRTMSLENGKVLCINESDIPEAIEMVKNGGCGDYKVTCEPIKRRDTKNPTIEEAIKLLEDGSHNYKKEGYDIAYGMALGALKACDELMKRDGGKSLNEKYDELDSKVKGLLNKLATGEITIPEYEKEVKRLAEKQKNTTYDYTFMVSADEFSAIKHALLNLLRRDLYLAENNSMPYPRNMTIEDKYRCKVEAEVCNGILEKIKEVE